MSHYTNLAVLAAARGDRIGAHEYNIRLVLERTRDAADPERHARGLRTCDNLQAQIDAIRAAQAPPPPLKPTYGEITTRRRAAVLDLLQGFEYPLCAPELVELMDLRGEDIDPSTLRDLLGRLISDGHLVRIPNRRTDLLRNVIHLYALADREDMAA